MADRLYVHIGTPKSGTTYLQTVLWTNQARLRGEGLLLPGSRRAEHNSAAVWARTRAPKPGTQRAWNRLLAEVRDWDGSAIISSEWFTMVQGDLITRFLSELEPAEIHLVLTARNFVSSVPAAWQERLKLGDSLPLDLFVDSLSTAENPRWNWTTLDPAVVLARWLPSIDPSRTHIVTVPPPGAPKDMLWQRFAAACGVAPDAVDLDRAFANESISVEAARLLQTIGPELRTAVDADTIGGKLPYQWIRNYFSHELLAARPGCKIALAGEHVAMLNQRATAMVARLEVGGYQVHGDLDDLVNGRNPEGSIHPDRVADDALKELALSIVPDILAELRRTRESADKKTARLAKLQKAAEERLPQVTVAAGHRGRPSLRELLRRRQV